ncbi:MAG: hypothetical protein Athens101428_663 [Candidatus Berkelbacteria bacterium Athens1014_28]|uniref:Uncharacterized protein n=1 Tax=Candidatus Berkelbacteria bacterium Athens1014_28 TaxID=2017145 RepID=A0A554LKY3_9BACT|nr:MAG: hypothetical protein Athens101428_663 [Candidatus Berkelbacteria bacterium Athens1014_28]
MNTSEIKKIFQTIQKNFHCPSCGSSYSYSDIHLINFSGNICFLRLICSCQTPVLASVAVASPKESNQIESKIETNELLEAMEAIDKISSINELINKK